MPDTPCGICGESGNSEDNCLLCFAITVASLLNSPGSNAKSESFIAKPDDGNGWRAYYKITFTDARGNGRLEIWAFPEVFKTQEEAAVVCDEIHDAVENCWETIGNISVVDLPEGRNAN